MSPNTDPEEDAGPVLQAIETYVVREHWAPIGRQALWLGAFLTGITLMTGLPVSHSLALVHVVTSASAIISGLLALKMERNNQEPVAVVLACRALAALLVSGAALLLVPLMP